MALIGIGQRAGKLVSGAQAVKSCLKRGWVKLLLMANDASPQSVQAIKRLAAIKAVPVITYGSKDDLGRLIGKSSRSALAVTDEHIAKGIIEAYERGDANRT